jgi:hypothetical protein
MDITYVDPFTGKSSFEKIIADAFARQGIQLAKEDFSEGLPLYRAVICAAGHHSKVKDSISLKKLIKFKETVAGLRATLADWRQEYESQGKAIQADTRGGLRSEPHLDFLSGQIGFDLSGHIGFGRAPGLNNLLAVLDAAETASARLLTETAARKAGHPPNGPFNALKDALHECYRSKAGKMGIKRDGERKGPFLLIMSEIKPHLPRHMLKAANSKKPKN